MKYLLFTLYHYYNSGSTKNIAYFCSYTALLVIIFLHILFFITLAEVDSLKLIPSDIYTNKLYKLIYYFIGTIVVIIGYLIFKRIIPHKKIVNSKYRYNRTHLNLLFFYIGFIFIYIMYSAFVRKYG